MARFILVTRRMLPFLSPNSPILFSKLSLLCTQAPKLNPDQCNSESPGITQTQSRHIKFPQIIPSHDEQPLGKGFHIETVDSGTWDVYLGLAESSQAFCPKPIVHSTETKILEEDRDFEDEIDEMRLHKELYYKLDKGSREFEENNISFHGKKNSRNKRNRKDQKHMQDVRQNDCKKKSEINKLDAKERVNILTEGGEIKGKKLRIPTFNQLTDPYHLPFCLDIHVTKGSVRACVVHRVTSKVVAVAHSISKDMKFDLGSRRDAKACQTVGAILAKRAIEDDIHNVVYTPRKGDAIEGKIEIVLRAIMDNGVDVKVKLKQKKQVRV